jgi:integrase
VANLERRGHTFYWRVRVPTHFRQVRRQARLSFSLRLSDHHKAAYMARRLNTLLADLTVRPTAAMTTKDQLDQLFRAEIERMTAHLDDIAFAVRRSGAVDDVREMEADIEVGWAYRLIQLFGTTRLLTFEVDCGGRGLLLRHGIPEPHIAPIAETFRAEQKQARSSVFDRDVRQQMADVGLADTLANRERAKMELYRAKADALLNVAERWPMIDRRQNALVATTLPEEERVGLAFVPAPEAAMELPTSASVQSAIIAEPILHGFSPDAAVNAVERSRDTVIQQKAPVALPAEIISAELSDRQAVAPSGRVLFLSGFENSCDDLCKNNKENWAPDTASDVRVLVRVFRDILEEHGVSHSGEIGQEHVAALRQHLNHIPKRYGQSARQRAMKPAALREFAAEEVARAERLGNAPPPIGLSAATIRKHLGNLDTFLNHVRASGYALADWSLKGLRPRKPKAGTLRLKQAKPAPETVRPIFDLPVFTGCQDATHRELPGDAVFHSGVYYLPMLFTYLGARRFEFAGLNTEDILDTPNGPAIHIRANDLRNIKNAQSDRTLPIPSEVLRLGFLDYVGAIRKLGHRQLFPELFSPLLKTNDPGDRFYKDFVPLVNASPQFSEDLWKRAIHALRHGFADTLKQAGVDSAVIDDISGRLGSSETELRYTNVAGLPLIKSHLVKYPSITGHLEPRPIRLLPWVAKKELPPWAGRKAGDRFRR